MRKISVLILSVAVMQLLAVGGFAQMVGSQIYLPGQFLEISQSPNGSFGTDYSLTPPPVYHPHVANLAEVYDYGHDGWTVGTPPEYGDYTYPGSPFEGWSIQAAPATTQEQAFYTCGSSSFCGTGGLTGSNVSYTNTGGVVRANWLGSYNGLVIKQETRIDTAASWVVVTTKFYNTTASNICNIYYMRSCDPDNDETWPGGAFSTNNHIDYQNDADHRVQVNAYGTYYTGCSLGLCTKDPRAKAFIYGGWPMSYTTNLGPVALGSWAGGFYTLGGWDNGDIAIGLAFNICCINAGDSDFISYAYVFNGIHGVDSAFPDPTCVVNNTMVVPPPAPSAVYDTFDACAYPGMTTMPMSIAYGSTGVWTWSTWSWAPSTGLSATTGTSVMVDLTAIPGNITYTVTGAFPHNGTCYDSVSRVMYITIHTCNTIWATANTPCVGDSLRLVCHPDTTAAIYSWYGPSGFTSSLQKPSIPNVTLSAAGVYTVIRTLVSSGFTDTANVTVTVNPIPLDTASSNSPLCAGAVDTLLLYASPVLPGETFSWTGPYGFTGNTATPRRDSFQIADTGIYTVTTYNSYGCSSVAHTHVVLLPPPVTPVITDPNYCTGDPFVNFTLDSITGVVNWFLDSVGGTASLFAPVVNTSIPGDYTFYASQVVGTGSSSCESPRGHVTVHVRQSPPAPTASSNSPICADSTLMLFANDTASGVTYHWSHATGYFTSTLQNPTIVNAQNGVDDNIYNVYVSELYTIPGSGSITCHSPSTSVPTTIFPTPGAPIITINSPCDGTELDLTTTDVLPGCNFQWYGPADTFTTGANIPHPITAHLGVNDGVYTVIATSGSGCKSVPATGVAVIHPLPPAPTVFDTTYCQHDGNIVPLVAVADTISNTLSWFNDSLGGAPLAIPITPVSSTIGTTTYWVMETTPFGCIGPRAKISYTILYKPDFNIVVSAPFACQDSSLTLYYSSTGIGASMPGAAYTWTLPWGTTVLEGSISTPTVKVQFDSIYNNYVYLKASDYNGSCSTEDTVLIKVEKMPTCDLYAAHVICVNDTIQVALTARGSSAYSFVWDFAGGNVIAANSNSGGPYSISWTDGGTKDVTVVPFTVDGCRGKTMHDTVVVRNLPDATFYASGNTRGDNVLCQEDSVLFVAHMGDSSNYLYSWKPEHYFKQNNKGVIWGQVGISGDITLQVTDEFSCTNSSSTNFTTESCCNIFMPTAFTPNGDGLNDKFHPIFTGYHRFHTFRIQNRWGQTVFECDDNTSEWDGNFGGVPQDMGVYFYYLKYDCGSSVVEKRGDVTLVR
jgi:gliding motility-associated-like protein